MPKSHPPTSRGSREEHHTALHLASSCIDPNGAKTMPEISHHPLERQHSARKKWRKYHCLSLWL